MRHVWISVLALVFLPAAAPARTDQDDIQKRVDGLVSQVERTLGVKFKNKVQADRQSAEEFKKFLLDSVKKELPEEKNRAITLYYRLLGLAGKDFDYAGTAVDLAAAQAGAYYNPETKKIHVLLGNMSPMVMDGMLFHELVHALQDQEHDLGAELKKLDAAGNSDRLAAYKFLVEGEASYWMQIYMLRKMGQDAPALRAMAFGMFRSTTTGSIKRLMKMQSAMASSPEMKKAAESLETAPPILIRTLVDPYLRGMYACHRIVLAKGEKEFRRMFREAPPTCTRDMMFSTDWLKNPRGVTEVALAPLGETLGEGWTRTYADTAGAVTFHTMFETQVKAADVVARRWNGDRLEVWSKGEASLLAGVATFDSEDAARTFAKQIERNYREEWTKGKEIKEHDAEFVHLSAEDDNLVVRVREKTVDFARGALSVEASALLETLGKSRLGDRTPSLPRDF